MSQPPAFGPPPQSDLACYRQVAMAAVALAVGMDDADAEALLAGRVGADTDWEALKQAHYAGYLERLTREAIVCYAAAAADRLAHGSPKSPDSIGGAAMARIHELLETMESPYANDHAEELMAVSKRALGHYYAACADALVHGMLLPAIVAGAEERILGRPLTVARLREWVLAAQP